MAKICIVSPSLKMGGIERALVTLAAEFHRLGNDIEFVICLKGNEFYELESGIKIHKPNFQRDKGPINKFLFYPRLLWFIRKKINSIQADSVLVFGDWFSPLTLLALLNTKHEVYISDRTIPNYKFSLLIRVLKKWLYPKSAGFIAQTTRSADYKKQLFGNKLNIKIIPNALPDLGKDLAVLENDEKIILYVGRFEWEKDPEILIRSFKIVLESHRDWKLIMAGDGPLLREMKKLSLSLGLDGKVEFLGKVKEVEKLYKTASIFVLPSIVEGFPNSLIEAMSFGLPCVCFSDIPYEDIISHSINGVVVDSHEPYALSEAIIKLVEKPDLRKKLGNAAISKVKCFEKSVISQKVLDFIIDFK